MIDNQKIKRLVERAERSKKCGNDIILGSKPWSCEHRYGYYQLEPIFVFMFCGITSIPFWLSLFAGGNIVTHIATSPPILIMIDCFIRKWLPHIRNVMVLRDYDRLQKMM